MQTCTEINVDTCANCVSGKGVNYPVTHFTLISINITGEAACPLLCGEPGLCQGIVIHREEASNTAQCQDACTNFGGCNYYTYDPATGECFMFDTCPSVEDAFCPDCVSGSPGCVIEDDEKGNIANQKCAMSFNH